MFFEFHNKKITGVLTVFPENIYYFEDEVADPTDRKALRLKKIIGYGARRRAKGTTTMSDLFLYGINHLLDEKKLNKEDIGALICVTLCPDYYMPQICSIVQGELGLSNDVFCIDIPQACAGYAVGLIEAFMLLDHMKDKKVVLCTGEVFNRKSNDNEPKYNHPTFGGDVGTVSIIENSDYNSDIHVSFYNDGVNRNNLIIPYGAFRNPMTPELLAARVSNLPCGHVQMDGSGVFNFVQREIPVAIEEIAKRAGVGIQDIDWFLFHQPNKFMLEKLAETLGVPYAKMPNDVTETVGNSDSGTIPVVMTTTAKDSLLKDDNLCCISGFGGGLTWASMIMRVGKLDFCESIISNL